MVISSIYIRKGEQYADGEHAIIYEVHWCYRMHTRCEELLQSRQWWVSGFLLWLTPPVIVCPAVNACHIVMFRRHDTKEYVIGHIAPDDEDFEGNPYRSLCNGCEQGETIDVFCIPGCNRSQLNTAMRAQNITMGQYNTFDSSEYFCTEDSTMNREPKSIWLYWLPNENRLFIYADETYADRCPGVFEITGFWPQKDQAISLSFHPQLHRLPIPSGELEKLTRPMEDDKSLLEWIQRYSKEHSVDDAPPLSGSVRP